MGFEFATNCLEGEGSHGDQSTSQLTGQPGLPGSLEIGGPTPLSEAWCAASFGLIHVRHLPIHSRRSLVTRSEYSRFAANSGGREARVTPKFHNSRRPSATIACKRHERARGAHEVCAHLEGGWYGRSAGVPSMRRGSFRNAVLVCGTVHNHLPGTQQAQRAGKDTLVLAPLLRGTSVFSRAQISLSPSPALGAVRILIPVWYLTSR